MVKMAVLAAALLAGLSSHPLSAKRINPERNRPVSHDQRDVHESLMSEASHNVPGRRLLSHMMRNIDCIEPQVS